MGNSTNPALSGIPIGDMPELSAAPVDAVAATGTLTSNNTQVTAGDTVTVDTKVYTFVASPLVEGDVHLVTNADTSLGNLVKAINGTGVNGTDYQCATAHTTVSAGNVSGGHATVLTARTKGTAGNAIALVKSAATLSVSGALFTGGVDGMPGRQNQFGGYSGQPYFCIADSTVASTGTWKKLSLDPL